MKRLLILIILLTLSVSAYAGKNITYISQTQCFNEACDCYNTNNNRYDYLFCSQLEKIGYNVIKLHESEIVNPTAVWDTAQQRSSLIFLGNVSDTVITGANAATFCTNIGNVLVSGTKQMFSTGKNNLVGKGCIFRLSYVQAPASNMCTAEKFVKLLDGYPTRELSVDDFNILNDDLYTPPKGNSYIQNQGSGWVGARCEEYSFDTYPVINTGLPDGTDEKAIFWGLNTPSNYTTAAWNLFNRTVWYVLDDYIFGDVSAYLKMSKSLYSPGEDLNITLIENGTTLSSAKLTLTYPDGTKTLNEIDMDYSGGIWNKSYVVERSAPNGTYTIKVRAVAPGSIREFTRSIIIYPYTVSMSTDKTSYSSGQDVNISVILGSVYSPSLNVTSNITIAGPSSYAANIFYGNAAYAYYKIHSLPVNAVGGRYTILVKLNDSDGRKYSNELSFIVKTSGNVTVTPSLWNGQLRAPGEISQRFSLKNNGQINVTGIQISATGLDISFDVDTLDILVGQNDSFTATVNITDLGTYNGTIILESEYFQYEIPVSIEYAYAPVNNSLFVTPGSISVTTVIGDKITKELELENIAPISAGNFVFYLSDSLKNIVNITQKPTEIGAESTEKMSIEINAANLQIASYTGTIGVNSSVGNLYITLNIQIIKNIGTEATALSTKLDSLKANITALANKRKDVSELNSKYNSTKTKIANAKTSYDNADYQNAQTYYQQASAGYDDLKDAVETLENQKANYSGIIWIVAIIIIIAIVSIAFYKYKDKIISLIKRKPEEKEEYTYTQGDYRTEYY